MGNTRRKSLEHLVCEGCSSPFTAVLPFARFCSRVCYDKTQYRKRSYSHRCVECGSEFTSRNSIASVCGPKCQRLASVRGGHEGAKNYPRIHPSRSHAYKLYAENRRDLLSKQDSEPYTAEEIFERDRWICGICRETVDRLLRFPHKRSACIDHIRPIIAGGNDLRSNVQCAHFDCNSRKGASVDEADS